MHSQSAIQENFDSYNKLADESSGRDQSRTSSLLLKDVAYNLRNSSTSETPPESNDASGKLTITPFDYSKIQDQVGRGITPPAFVSNREQIDNLSAHKDLLATVAKINFSDLDKDGNHLLDRKELSMTAKSTSLSPDVSAAAQILFDNFADAKDLARSTSELTDIQLFGTDSAKERYKSTFGDDDSTDGISEKDLSVLYMLGSKDGQEQITSGVRDAEIREGWLHVGSAAGATAATVAAGTGSAAAWAGVISAPIAIPLAAACATSILWLSTEIQGAYNSFLNSGESALANEVLTKQSLLDSWNE